MSTQRLRATVIVEYDADPGDYGTDDPLKMAKIDAGNWRQDPLAFLTTFEEEDYTVSVRPVVVLSDKGEAA